MENIRSNNGAASSRFLTVSTIIVTRFATNVMPSITSNVIVMWRAVCDSRILRSMSVNRNPRGSTSGGSGADGALGSGGTGGLDILDTLDNEPLRFPGRPKERKRLL